MNKPFDLFNPLSATADIKERQTIASTLELIYDLSDKDTLPASARANEMVEIDDIIVKIIEGSDFEQSHRSSKTVLRQLVRQPEFARLSGPFGPTSDEFILITEDRTLLQAETTHSPATHFEFEEVTEVVTRAIPTSKADIELLAKAAALTGGIVSSSDYIPLKNWLKFHQLDTPKNVFDISNLISLLQLELPAPPPYGNYWGLSDDTEETLLAITPEHHSLLKQQIARVANKDSDRPEPLLNYLTDTLFDGNRSRAFLQEEPEKSWELIVDTQRARDFAQACFEAMNPQADSADKTLSPHECSRLLVAAVMLDFGLAEESDQQFYRSFYLYDPRYVQANLYDIRANFTDIVASSNVQATAAPLALQLIFSGLAPEFLVDAPAALQLGSSGWVMLRKSVMLAEATAPGLSRRMSYESLKELGAIAPASPAQQTLHDLILTRCVLDWSTINGLDLNNAANLPTQTLVEHATTQYNAFLGETREAFKNISTAPPSRRDIARSALQEAGLDPELKLSNLAGSSNSLLDLYLARQLTAYFDAKRLENLEPANTLYTREVDSQYALHKKGLTTFIRLALSQIPLEDRVAIEQGHLALYRVFTVAPIGFDGQLHRSGEKVAPYGIVMLSQVNEEVTAHDLFPLLGTCRINQELVRQITAPDRSGKWDKGEGALKTEIFLLKASIDSEVYFKGKALDNGSQPGTRNVLLEQFASIDKRSQISYQRSPMQSYNARRFRELAQQVAEHQPPLPYDAFYAMGYDKTELEESYEAWQRLLQTILNILIPFKECFEGLASDNKNQRDNALFSCVMDATVLLFTFVGGAGAFTKAFASSSRLLSLGKVGSRFVLSLFNPLEGVPQLIQGGARLVGKGALKLGHYGLSITRLGAGQLRRLTNSTSGSYDLIKALSKSGAAAEVRKSLPTIAHARALFKDDTLESVEQIVARLSEKNVLLPKGASSAELEHLFNNAVREAALPARPLQDLQSLIGHQATNDLLIAYIEHRPAHFNGAQFTTGARDYSETLGVLGEIETKKINYLKNHQQSVLKQDLGKAPYADVMPESAFNPQGYTDNAQRAGAWMLKGSTSDGNDLGNIVAILREYAGNKKSLTDSAVIKEIHDRLVPHLAGSIRNAGAPTKYGGSISGYALMDQHLKTLDAAHEHFDKHLLAAIAGFQGFGDGNGRTASAVYAISQLRGDRFTPMPKHVFMSLSDLG